ncbi:MAG TPA: GDSL-type esterase/lipase family protein [Gemmataceae bacterium]|nr:GDSL-type esterase/lipase family protein [Gemmataceae bacterium]
MAPIRLLCTYRPAFVLAGLTLLLACPRAHAQQFVLFDATFTFTKADADNSKPSKSHYYVRGEMLNADRPRDWTRPVDYRNGTVHIRAEVIEKPAGGAPTTWSLCYIPNKGQKNGYGCTGTDVYREKGVYEKDVKMTSFWQNDNIVWEEGIKEMHLVMKDDSGGAGHAHKRPDPEKFFPTKMRITMVQVAAGARYDPKQVPDLPASDDPQSGKAADNPAARKLNRDIPRHREFLKRIEQTKGAGDVVFLGDSITHGWEGQKAWQEHFGPFHPVNLGIGGDQTGHVLWRITDGHELDHLNPKAAVLMIGTNNIGGHTAEQIAGGITAIVEELRRQKPGIKVLVLGVFPRGSSADAERSLEQITEGIKPINEELKKEKPDLKRLNAAVRDLERRRGTIPAARLNPTVAEINAIIAKLDDGKAVFFKDIGQGFLDPKGGLSGDIMSDYLHLSPRGYDIWGKAIKADIEKLIK